MNLNNELLEINLQGIKKPETLIKRLLEAYNYSIRTLANKANINYSQLCLIVRGNLKISKKISEKVAYVFDIKPHLLYKLRLENDIIEYTNKIKKQIKKLDT